MESSYLANEPQTQVHRQEKTTITTTTTRVESSNYKRDGYKKQTQLSNTSSIENMGVVESNELFDKTDDEVSMPHVVRPKIRDDPRVVNDRVVNSITECKIKSRSDQVSDGKFSESQAKRQIQTSYTFEERREQTDIHEADGIYTGIDSAASTLISSSDMNSLPSRGAVKHLRDKIELRGNNSEQKKTSKRVDIFKSLDKNSKVNKQHDHKNEDEDIAESRYETNESSGEKVDIRDIAHGKTIQQTKNNRKKL
ncbi:unnamed protein product [Cylicocyclus nassatus]|uniref:Uncharacterized protein n=1 Tax=Cylicocyclus nassatus TaxID=53992 RepID=A0AA36M6A2_CYLNA|nr:unnamed protein product [Cylicocyclus nassatus]